MNTKDDVLEVEGVVDQSLPNTTFRVTLDSGQSIWAHLSGKMRLNYIKILPGDRVIVEMSVYDLSKGRITRRLPLKSSSPVVIESEITQTPDTNSDVAVIKKIDLIADDEEDQTQT